MPNIGFKLTQERIENMVTLIALNNCIGFVYCMIFPWYLDDKAEGIYLFKLDSANGGLFLLGAIFCPVGGVVASAVAFALHWSGGCIANYTGSSWIANCIATRLKWLVNVACVNLGFLGLVCGFQVKGLTPAAKQFSVGFYALLQNVLFGVMAAFLLLYYPCAPAESGDDVWNLYGLLGPKEADQDEAAKTTTPFSSPQRMRDGLKRKIKKARGRHSKSKTSVQEESVEEDSGWGFWS
eukprot:GEMP01059173.1.p1 GENE.GEMP01059173.1~~GEMP01059173.1.p1  ORF type:complete len:238 (+),score=34.95 GEMP01059173.1:186-899(+)